MPYHVHFIDTSILCNILKIPGKCQDYEKVTTEFKNLVNNSFNRLLLPLATIIETGNHIAHVSDGTQRKNLAKKFEELLVKTADNEAPWEYYRFDISQEQLKDIATDFPNKALSLRMGVGDLSIIQAYNKYKEDIPVDGTIRIWSMDSHLKIYTDKLTIPSKRERKKRKNTLEI